MYLESALWLNYGADRRILEPTSFEHNRPMKSNVIKKLSDTQLETFDTEYADGDRWNLVKALIERDFPDGRFTFLDVGGGNGRFADRLLSTYPRSSGCVFDNSEVLLAKNSPNPRKEIYCESVEGLGALKRKFDLISVHWLLHHLVGDSYTLTGRHQLGALLNIAHLLTERGRVSVFENNYMGWLLSDLPGRLIYHATSARSLAAMTRKLGANTAGIGVCFHSKKQWMRMFEATGFDVANYREPDAWKRRLRWYWRVFLLIKDVRVGHYWLSRSQTVAKRA
jgi:hypothetical protein